MGLHWFIPLPLGKRNLLAETTTKSLARLLTAM
jgi:hypothetical protein